MKKIRIFILALFTYCTLTIDNCFAQWVWQNPLPQGEYLYNISFTNTGIGAAVGYLGTIIRTTNGGANWSLQSSGTTTRLSSVSLADANSGTVVGNNGLILNTTNGGVNWNLQTSGTANTLNGVFCTDANTGTAVGNNGTILRTTNGGINWNLQTSGTTGTLLSVFFTDANTFMSNSWRSYLARKIIRARDKSYGVRSTVTLSPGRILM